MANESTPAPDARSSAIAQSTKSQAPEIGRAFAPFFQGLMKEGALTVKQKELIAVGISVAIRCEPCIDAHVEKAIKAGATREEVLETAGVAVMMGGGPAYTHVPKVAAALGRVGAGG